MARYSTLKKTLSDSAEKFSGKIAFQIRSDGKFKAYSFTKVKELAFNLSAKLRSLGIEKGDRVALLGENRPEWPIAYLAIVSMGAVVVPLDSMLSPESLAPLYKDSGAKGLIVSDKFKASASVISDGFIIGMFEIEKMLAPQNAGPDENVELSDLAAILYTSGTTGEAKGVMLTHENLMSNVWAVSQLFSITPKDNFLSVLPLHHTFEATCGFIAPFYLGARVTYSESLKSYNLLRDMQETGTTIMCGVPLLYQLFYGGIMREVEEKGKLAKNIFKGLLSASRWYKKIVGFSIGRKLFGMVHKKFGGKIRFFVSGGAAIDPGIIRGFDEMGFTILQGYGLTESSPILCVCNLKENRIGSVGKPLNNVHLRITGTDPIGEIIASGPNIMKGYYRRKDLTNRVLVNGWLHTGDLGYQDEDEYVFITGRSKDVIVTSSGVNVYPGEVELVLNKDRYIKESCVMGRKRKEGLRKGMEEIYAVLVPDMEVIEREKGKTSNQALHFLLQEQLREINKKLAEFQRIADFTIYQKDFPKTSTRKIKRFALRREIGL